MSDNAEEGIARAQAEAAKAGGSQENALREQQKRNTANLDDRIIISALALAFIGLLVVWATATSALVVYGSFAAGLILIVIGGVFRIRYLQRVRRDRERQAAEWKSENDS